MALLLIKVMRICDHCSSDHPGLHFELHDFIVSVHGLPRLRFEAMKVLNFDFNADPDPAFHCNADQYPAPKNNADPRGSGSSALNTLHSLEQKGKADLIKDDISNFFFLFVAIFVFPITTRKLN